MELTLTVEQSEVYATPVLADLGSVKETTLGSAGNNNADDTQYWQ